MFFVSQGNLFDVYFKKPVPKAILKLSLFASWADAMINPQWLELSISRTNFHLPKEVPANEIQVHLEKFITPLRKGGKNNGDGYYSLFETYGYPNIRQITLASLMSKLSSQIVPQRPSAYTFMVPSCGSLLPNSTTEAVKQVSVTTAFGSSFFFFYITKTCLFKYTENFTTKKWKFSDKKFIFLPKT